MKEEVIILTEQQINTVLAYLAERPFKEVNSLINMIQTEWKHQHSETECKGEVEGQK